MRVAIMQPTYMPWCGYFALMDQSDKFVLLDNVALSKPSWQHRNRIKTARGELWLSVPVLSKGRQGQLISEAEIDVSRDVLSAHCKSIEHAYGKAPFFRAYAQPLFNLLAASHRRLIDLNLDLLMWLRGALGIDTPLLCASSIALEKEDVDSCNTDARVERVARICQNTGATEFLCPPGAFDYIDKGREAFDRRGISISCHCYHHPVYDQSHGTFVPYLSVIDLIFAHGPDSLDIIRQGYREKL